MNETYKEMRDRHQKAMNALPLFWAFTLADLEKKLEEKGLTKSDICRAPLGGFCAKKDESLIRGTIHRLNAEEVEALKDDQFFKSAVAYELANHEACITGSASDALGALGLEYKELSDYRKEVVNAQLREVCKSNWE